MLALSPNAILSLRLELARGIDQPDSKKLQDVKELLASEKLTAKFITLTLAGKESQSVRS